MPSGAVISALLHLVILALVVFGLPAWFEPDVYIQPVSVQVVAMSNDALPPAREAEEAPDPEEIPPSEQIAEAPPLPPEQVQPSEIEPLPELAPAEQPEQAAAPEISSAPQVETVAPSEPVEAEASEPPAEESAPQADQPAEVQPDPQVAAAVPPEEVVAAEPPDPTVATEVVPEQPDPLPIPQPKPEIPEKQPEDAPTQVAEKEPDQPKPDEKEPEKQADPKDFASVLKDLTQQDAASPSPPPAAQEPEPARTAERSEGLNAEPLTMGEMDRVKQEIEGCWLLPSSVTGAKNADFSVEVRVQLDEAGNVLTSEALDSSRLADPVYESVARSIILAMKKCSPLKTLPAGKFGTWREITLKFNLKEYLGT